MKAILMMVALLLTACASDDPPTCGDCHSDCGVLRDSCHEACERSLCRDAGTDGGEEMQDDGWT